jgi:hypothetical protein
MPMLAELADVIIGAGTRTGTHTAAAVDRLGAHLATIKVSADAAGYARLAGFAAEHAPGLRTAWAIEGCGSHGAGLARALATAGHLVIEADRPRRTAAAAASPMSWTPSAPHARPWPSPITPVRALARPARPCGSCWPPASTPPGPAPPP